MSKWLFGFCAVLIGIALAVPEAEARRFGGARSLGVQRSVPKQPPAAAPTKPAQQQTAPNQAGQQQAASGASGTGRWGGILGGLALGGLLGYLFAGNGLGGILLVALLAIGAVLLFRMLAHRGAPQPQQSMQYAGLGRETLVTPPPPLGGGAAVRTATGVALPQGFDEAAFLRGAKMNFIRLQAANDEGRLEEIRELATDEMYEALRSDPAVAGQRTEVTSLQADLVELTTENDRHWASVRFTGLVRETPGAEPEGFAEVWHLVKPADGSSGWLLAGIQQMH